MDVWKELIVAFKLQNDEFNRKLDQMNTDVSTKTNTLMTKLSGFAAGFAKIAAGLVVTGLGAVATGIGVAIDKSIEWGTSLDDIGDVLGGTTEQAAGLALMGQRVGVDIDSLTSSMQILTRNTTNLDGSLTETGEYLQSLGISVLDSNGNFRDAYDIFQDVSDVIGEMPSGLDRSNAMMTIFGRSGAQIADALDAAANGGLSNFNDQAEQLGLALSPEQTQNTIDFSRKIEELKQTFSGLAISLGTELLPIIEPLINDFVTFAQENLPAVKEKLKEVTDWISETGLPALEDFSNWFNETALTAIQGFLNGSQKLDWDVIATWIENGVSEIDLKIEEWKDSSVAQEKFQDYGRSITTYIIDGLVEAFDDPQNKSRVLIAIADFMTSWQYDLQEIIRISIENMIIGGLDVFAEKLGIGSNFRTQMVDYLSAGVSDPFETTVNNMWTQTDWGAVARSVSNSIIEAFNNPAIFQAASDTAARIVSTFQEKLGIHSPSTVFYGFGENLAQGLAEGFEAKQIVSKSMGKTVSTVTNNSTSYNSNIKNYNNDFDYDKLVVSLRDALLISGAVT
jgi:hypothetical protein